MQQEERSTPRPIVGVIGGSGGVGASSFAGAVANAAGRSVLVDIDVDGGGIDVVLGIESTPGARWSGLRLAGGALDPATLLGGLPPWGGCAVLAADVAVLEPDAVTQVIGTAAQAGSVVLDLPRRDCAERAAAIAHCDLVVVLARGDVAGLVSAHAVASGLSDAAALGLLVRSGGRTARGGCAGIGAQEAARVVDVELLGSLPALRPGDRTHDPLHPSRVVSRVIGGLLDGVRTCRVAIAPPDLHARLEVAGAPA